ncbi:hypothetical protein ScPMuIL_015107 [Solemya velum]
MNGLHYHNNVNGGKYIPISCIKTEPLASKYTVNGDIGRGKFAVVRKCTHIETGKVVAAKFIKKRRRGKSCREEIFREVVMLELALDHPRLVDLKEVFETQSEFILITEYCSGGELFHECVIEESFQESDVVRLMVQILEGLVYLHEKNIVHLDLKPQNVLLTEPFPKGDIKLCDLGFACLVNTGEDIREIIGTPDYVAPEVLDYEPLGLYTDMWSLGVLTYVMLTAHSPFAGASDQETFSNITQVNLDFPQSLFSAVSHQSQDFIRKLLIKDHRKRMTASQCLDHPWIKGATEIPKNPSPVTEAENMLDDIEIKSDKGESFEPLRSETVIISEKPEKALDMSENENENDRGVMSSIESNISTSESDSVCIHLEDEPGLENTKEISNGYSENEDNCTLERQSVEFGPMSEISEAKSLTNKNHSGVNSEPFICACEEPSDNECAEKNKQNSKLDAKNENVNDLELLGDANSAGKVTSRSVDKLLKEEPRIELEPPHGLYNFLPDCNDQQIAKENCNNSNSVMHENKRTEQMNGCTDSFSTEEVPPKILKCSEEETGCPSFIPTAVYVERREEIITENSHEIRTEILEYVENVECISIDSEACI